MDAGLRVNSVTLHVWNWKDWVCFIWKEDKKESSRGSSVKEWAAQKKLSENISSPSAKIKLLKQSLKWKGGKFKSGKRVFPHKQKVIIWLFEKSLWSVIQQLSDRDCRFICKRLSREIILKAHAPGQGCKTLGSCGLNCSLTSLESGWHLHRGLD